MNWSKILKKDGLELKNLTNQTYDLCYKAILNNSKAIQYVNSDLLTNEEYYNLCNLTDNYYNILQHINKNKLTDEQYYNFCNKALKTNGIQLKYIKKQTDELCKTAVQSNSYEFIDWNINYPNNGNDLLSKRRITPLYYVKNQTYDICKLAIEFKSDAFYDVRDKTKEILIFAIKNTIQFLNFDDDINIIDLFDDEIKKNIDKCHFCYKQKNKYALTNNNNYICITCIKKKSDDFHFHEKINFDNLYISN